MACEYLVYSDFPHRGIPLRAWPQYSHLMGTPNYIGWEESSIINDIVALNSGILSSIDMSSIAIDSISMNSIILEK